jgi:hypothetical protein
MEVYIKACCKYETLVSNGSFGSRGSTAGSCRQLADIIHHMFVEEPHACAMKNVAGFFYGNGVPVDKATRCYAVCNGYEFNSVITEGMYRWYAAWDKATYSWHKLEYYNMRVKSMVWVNGKAFAQREEERTGRDVLDFGLRNSGCPLLIQCAIENVRAFRKKESGSM